MAQKTIATMLFVLSLFFLTHVVVKARDPAIFDITKYGAKPKADIAKALTNAWKEACASTTKARVVIPAGTWQLSQVRLAGPNKSPLELQVRGTLEAPVGPLPNKDANWITINYLNGFEISGGGVFDGKGKKAWKQNDCGTNKKCAKLPLNLSFNFINNVYIHDVTTKDSKNFHSNLISSNNVTIQRFTISAPGESINTDGIHIARGTNISVLDSVIGTGDDCISVGDETKELHITNVTCGPGHGISIGSLGGSTAEKDVIGVYVRNCTFKNTRNGVQVKTWPSAPATLAVKELHFEDLIMENVTSPIVIDQEYCPSHLCKLDSPSLVKISDVYINNIRGTSFWPEAAILICSRTNPCKNVNIGNIHITYSGTTANTTMTKCANVKPTLTGKQNFPICPAQGLKKRGRRPGRERRPGHGRRGGRGRGDGAQVLRHRAYIPRDFVSSYKMHSCV